MCTCLIFGEIDMSMCLHIYLQEYLHIYICIYPHAYKHKFSVNALKKTMENSENADGFLLLGDPKFTVAKDGLKTREEKGGGQQAQMSWQDHGSIGMFKTKFYWS